MRYEIKNISFLNENDIKNRKIEVTLENNTVITIEACYESWEQYGGTTDELWSTISIAEKYNRWLHGEDFID